MQLVLYLEMISAKPIIGLIFINICASKVFQSVHCVHRETIVKFPFASPLTTLLGVTKQGLLPPVHWGRN